MYGNERQTRPGFTLVELLVTVTVIGIIVAMAMGALMTAQETAREQRTRAVISKLHTQLMSRWETYQTRRLPMPPMNFGAGETPAQYAGKRTLALRELMRLELPQRWYDITSDDLPFEPNSLQDGPPPAAYLNLTELPALSEAYLRRLTQIRATVTPQFESAECLYMIVTMGHDDSLSGQNVRPTDVGDVDEDGAPEFLDGWGRPISFLRWAPGYLPLSALPAANADQAATTDLHTGDQENDHDPFDPLRLDAPAAGGPPRGYRLMPLIYSAGADGESDIWSKNAGTGLADFNDPYYFPAPSDGLPSGTPMTAQNSQSLSAQGEGRHIDNITNHALEVR